MKLGNCLAMINRPIEASIPSTTAVGNNAAEAGRFEVAQHDLHGPRHANHAQQQRIAVLKIAAPNRAIDASRAGASPAAGPLIVT